MVAAPPGRDLGATFFLLAATLVSAASALLITRAYHREAAQRQKADANEQQALASRPSSRGSVEVSGELI